MTVAHSENSPAGPQWVLRRLALVITFPVWMWIILVFCLVSGVRSSLWWLRTGQWLLPEELPAIWLDKIETKVWRWTCRWLGHAH